jgi:hypothetical protein
MAHGQAPWEALQISAFATVLGMVGAARLCGGAERRAGACPRSCRMTAAAAEAAVLAPHPMHLLRCRPPHLCACVLRPAPPAPAPAPAPRPGPLMALQVANELLFLGEDA